MISDVITLTKEEKQLKQKIETLKKTQLSCFRETIKLMETCSHKIEWYFTDRAGGVCKICGASFGPYHPEFQKLLETRENNKRTKI